MTKEEVDVYFAENWLEIEQIVKTNMSHCATENKVNIASDLYLICLDKRDEINCISSFIRILARNTYKWKRSKFNIENQSLANENEVTDTYIDEDTSEDVYQNRLFAIEKYYANAQPHERILYDIYFNQNITTIRGLVKHLNISFHGANVMLKEFKQKIKSYEREI
jgi:hypothetical protein